LARPGHTAPIAEDKQPMLLAGAGADGFEVLTA
jgi:hypothetical protein